jgi:hypothetical protein
LTPFHNTDNNTSTTFHVLNILLQRPFLEEGHLKHRSSEEEKQAGEEICVQSALAIWKLASAYRNGLTLRRAPFLLSYAVYSAVVVMLRQGKSDREKFNQPIAFFWTALSELQRGCNFGLRKPVLIVRDMMNELGESMPQMQDHPEMETALSRLMELRTTDSYVPSQPSSGVALNMGTNLTPLTNDIFDQSQVEFLEFLDEERTIADDTLWGLFAEHQSFF